MQEDFTKVFSSTLKIGDYKESSLALFENFSEEITIVTTDNFFLKFVKPLDILLKERGKTVSVFSFSDGQILNSKEEIFKNEKILLAIGNSELIDLCRHFCQKFNVELVVVLTDLIISSAFKGVVRGVCEEGLFETKCSLPNKVIVDYNILREVSKKRMADSFCNSLSYYFSLCELELSKPAFSIQDEKFSLARSYVLKAMEFLKECDKKPFENLVLAEFSISYALYILEDLLKTTSESFALVLSQKTGVSLFECKARSAEILFNLYNKAMQKNVILNDAMPNYLQAVEAFCAIFKISEEVVLKNFIAYSFDEVKEKYNLIFEKEKKSQKLENMIKNFQEVKNCYKSIYSARQKRASFTKSELSSCLKASGVIANYLYKLLFDSGVIELVE